MILDMKLAACPLLADYTNGVQYMCRAPYDCGLCPLFIERMEYLDISQVLTWACWRCVKGDERDRIARGTLLGFYTEGHCSWCGAAGFLLNAMATG